MAQEVTTLEKVQLADEVSQFLEKLLERAGLELTHSCLQGDCLLTVQLEGKDADLLLAADAGLLNAINRLLNLAFYRRSSNNCNILVDCNNYRAVRDRELQLLAQKAAEKAKISGVALPLQPMSAGDRRLVHLALAEEAGVRTESEGSGMYRRVLIFPV